MWHARGARGNSAASPSAPCAPIRAAPWLPLVHHKPHRRISRPANGGLCPIWRVCFGIAARLATQHAQQANAATVIQDNFLVLFGRRPRPYGGRIPSPSEGPLLPHPPLRHPEPLHQEPCNVCTTSRDSKTAARTAAVTMAIVHDGKRAQRVIPNGNIPPSCPMPVRQAGRQHQAACSPLASGRCDLDYSLVDMRSERCERMREGDRYFLTGGFPSAQLKCPRSPAGREGTGAAACGRAQV